MPPKERSPGRRVAALAPLLALLIGSIGVSARASAGTLEEARARLAEHTEYFRSVAAEAEAARSELAEIEESFDAIEKRVRATAGSMLENEAEAVSWARDLYMGGSMDALEALLTSESLSDVDTQLTYLQFSSDRRRVIFEELFVKRQELDQELEALSAARAEAEAVVARLSALQSETQARLEQIRSEVASLTDELAAELSSAEAAAGVAQTAAVVEHAPVPGPPYNADWDAIAMCESGGNWHLDGTYDGGLQFHPSTWLAYGGGQYAEYAWQATREQQIAIGEKVLEGQGPGAWPHCFQE